MVWRLLNWVRDGYIARRREKYKDSTFQTSQPWQSGRENSLNMVPFISARVRAQRRSERIGIMAVNSLATRRRFLQEMLVSLFMWAGHGRPVAATWGEGEATMGKQH